MCSYLWQPVIEGGKDGEEEEEVGLGVLLASTDVLPAKTWVGRVAL